MVSLRGLGVLEGGGVAGGGKPPGEESWELGDRGRRFPDEEAYSLGGGLCPRL